MTGSDIVIVVTFMMMTSMLVMALLDIVGSWLHIYRTLLYINRALLYVHRAAGHADVQINVHTCHCWGGCK